MIGASGAWTYTGSLIGGDPITALSGELTFFEPAGSQNKITTPSSFSTSPVGGEWETITAHILQADYADSSIHIHAPIESFTGEEIGRAGRNYLYDCLHILPIYYDGEREPRLEVGSVTRSQTYTVYLWNAYLDSVTIASTTFSQGGITLDTTGTTLASNELGDYTVTTDAEGAPTIDCLVTIDITSEQFTFEIAGSRTYAPPVWAQVPVMETLQFKTWKFVSENGKEQRMDLRDLPRRIFTYECIITAADFLSMQHIIRMKRNNRALIPIFHEVTFINDASYYIGDTVVAVDTSSAEYYVGGYAGLYGNGTVHFSEITEMTANSITLRQPLESDFYAGDARVFPMVTGSFKGSISVEPLPYKAPQALNTINSASLQKAKFRFETYEGDDLRGYTTPDRLNGIDIIPWPSENLGSDYYQIKQWEVDFDVGAFQMGTQDPAARIGREWRATFSTRAELWAFRRFCHSHTNRVPFWISLNHYNLLAVANISAGATTVDVLDSGFYDSSDYRTAIAIRHPDGTIDYREILNKTRVGNIVTLEVDALSNTSEMGSLQTKISFMVLARIDGDVRLRHFGHKSEAAFAITEVFQ